MDIYETFREKTIFFTGVTGFVGKVLLWKLVKEFPDIKKIIVLIRTKKGQSPADRFREEVLKSMCWGPLAKELGDAEFKRRISKIVAVSGDIVQDRIGLSAEDYSLVTAEANFIVHLAATVNFDERLDTSVKMNVLGAVRVLSLAQRCSNLTALIHVSTCYVSYQRNGRQIVREIIYPLPFDPEDMCKYILAQDPAVINMTSARVLKEHGFPNTYTFTKSMAEQILERRRGSVPLAILRPSIIGCAWREPMPGWVDALTAAGGLFLTAGLGILREVHCNGANIADIIPVDYVVNGIIKLVHRVHTFTAAQKTPIPKSPMTTVTRHSAAVAPAIPALGSKTLGGMPFTVPPAATPNATSSGDSDGSSSLPLVYQCSTSSSLNLLRWETAALAVHHYWGAHPHSKAIAKVDTKLIPNYYVYRMRFITHRVIPITMMKAAASLPVVGSPSKRTLVERLERAAWRSQDLQRQFAPFMNNEWCFDATNAAGLDEFLQPEHVKRFLCDPYDINWHAYTVAYCYGMAKFIMKSSDERSPPLLPEGGTQLFLKAML